MILGDALRLKLPRDAAEKLARNGKLARVQAKLLSEDHYTDSYFDTPRSSFYRAGTTFRVRTQGSTSTQTIRQLQPNGAEMVLKRQLPNASQVIDVSEDWDDQLALGRTSVLPSRRIFSANIARRVYRLSAAGCKLKLTLFEGEIRSAGPVFNYVAETVCDGVLELVKGDRQVFFDYALALVEAYDARLQTDTIANRGFALTSPSLKKSHAKARKVRLDPGMSVGTAFEAILQSSISHLLANQTAALRGDPNGIHQTRVAMRRLRAALRAFKRALPYEGRKAFNGELRWFQQRTGPARDWHVFADETLPRLKARHVSAEALTSLRKLAARDGQIQAREAAKLLQSRRHTRMLLRFGKWVASLFEDGRCPQFADPVLPFARKTLAKTHRDLLKELEQARPNVMEDMHHVRIRGKKARYACEFFAALFEGESVKTYLQLVETLQDRLGAANDARVAKHLIAELEHGKLSPATIDGIQLWSSERVARCLDQASPTLQALQSAQPFWKTS